MSQPKALIHFFGIPIPPSVNAQYATIIRHGKPIRIPSKEAKDYEKVFKIWALQNKQSLNDAKQAIVQWGKPLRVSMVLALKKERLLTKDGRMKRLDVSNRTKSIHDLLSDCLGIDDCLFAACPIEKVIADTYDEQVVISIGPMTLRGLSEVDLQA